MNTRVVVTGMGAITPIGNSVEAFWTAVKSNTVGIAPITHFDTADFKDNGIWKAPSLSGIYRIPETANDIKRRTLDGYGVA